MITQDEFNELVKQGYTHIPLIKKRLMDDATPVSVFANLRQFFSSAYLFESVVGGERWARYSMIGLGSHITIQYHEGQVVVKDGRLDEITTHAQNPFDFIRSFMAKYKTPNNQQLPDLPVFSGGLVGYFGHDMIRVIEPSVGMSDAPNLLKLPDMWLTLSDQVVVFDNLEHTLSVVVYADATIKDGYKKALKNLAIIENLLSHKPDLTVKKQPFPHFVSQTGQNKFCLDVKHIKEYIKAGDVMQVVPAQRLSAEFEGDPLAVYRALRYLNPSPYLFLIQGELVNDEPFHIVGASPEILSRIETVGDERKVTVRPLAGTRRRGVDAAEDLALEAELLSDQKEIAEHLMLIDLGRNDIGKVCDIGTVKVTDKMFIERYSQVMHIASNVEGVVSADKDALDVFCATFPAGTLSGAPKIRAMQIIDEVEPVRRSVFGGAVGYLGWSGNMDTAIAIRTAVLKDGQVHIQAGAGVVADSDPVAEWDETNKKALAIVKAVEMACGGLLV
ncbi:chorismate-binding protein [Moraxella sp. Tifton1]|uniref:anthranilate synthase component I family protein n=1 Tax=Moraxella oculi TaxID=2940516 RepID=UPI002012FA2A|nr:anthranilate synthase component I family protein [Moraxella sp. Tifton1]MCL1623429.1 chorismate-binding protein [Moraxella sp. Tifton1]